MAVNEEVASRYTAHGLRLIRLANGLTKSTSTELRALAEELRRALRDYDPSMSYNELRAMLKEVNATIRASYASISAAQVKELNELLDVEFGFVTKASGLKTPSTATRTRAKGRLLVHGATPAEQWVRQADNMSWAVTNAVRASHSAGATRKSLLTQIIGSGKKGRELGGVIETSMRNARGVVDSSVQATTTAARLASFDAPGSKVNALLWYGILDTKICPNCGIRAGKLYDTKMKPIGHSIPMVSPPPLHHFCRCILLPQQFPDGPPKDGGKQNDRFENWLEKQSRDVQEDLLGAGRVELWRSGKITMSQLVGQDGLVQTLEELKANLASR